jgi:N-terminal acetyltransferase B complex catalytic subunit
MYTKLGYTVYRRVLDYYTGENDEDAFGEITFESQNIKTNSGIIVLNAQTDMRKACSRDVMKKSIIPLTHPVTADELD